eukprot:11820847-Alexandrium_andersonii.AAC.1
MAESVTPRLLGIPAIPAADASCCTAGLCDVALSHCAMGVRFLRLGAPAMEYFETGEAASGEAASGSAMDAGRVDVSGAVEPEEAAAPPVGADARSEMEQWS